MKHIKRTYGFTLIELLMVVVIIAVLAAVAVPQYKKAVLKSNFSTVLPSTKALAQAQEVYYLANRNYAFYKDELDLSTSDTSQTTVTLSDKNNYKYVMGQHAQIPGVHYIMYQKHSRRFADNVHCEALKSDGLANWLCEKGLGGTLITGSISGTDYFTYLLSGNAGTDKFIREDCPEGYYDKEGTCTTSPAGSYADEGELKACADGSISAAGASFCSPCPAGKVSNEDHTVCSRCGDGLYNDTEGASSCKLCPLGTARFGTGNTTTCLACKEGSYSDTEGLAQCKQCTPGTYQSQTGQTSCLPCPIGTCQTSSGQAACLASPAGYYSDTEGLTHCKACTPGTYQSQTGQTSCLPCPIGTYQTASGQAECFATPAGAYADTEGVATYKTCPSGTYQPKTGQASCLPCPAGTYQPGTGRTECIQCPEGTVPNEGRTHCN